MDKGRLTEWQNWEMNPHGANVSANEIRASSKSLVKFSNQIRQIEDKTHWAAVTEAQTLQKRMMFCLTHFFWQKKKQYKAWHIWAIHLFVWKTLCNCSHKSGATLSAAVAVIWGGSDPLHRKTRQSYSFQTLYNLSRLWDDEIKTSVKSHCQSVPQVESLNTSTWCVMYCLGLNYGIAIDVYFWHFSNFTDNWGSN